MKKNDLSEVKKMDLKALNIKIETVRREITGLHLSKLTNKIANLKEKRLKKRDLAQMLTVSRQKQLLAELENQNAS